MSRFPNEYDDGYDGRESFERADEDRPEDLEDVDWVEAARLVLNGEHVFIKLDSIIDHFSLHQSARAWEPEQLAPYIQAYVGSNCFTATAAPGEDLRDPEVLARSAKPVGPPNRMESAISQLGRPNQFPQRSAFFTLDQWVHAAKAMEQRGGHFASAIGTAMVYADTDNQNRLAFVFRDLIWQYVPEEYR